MKKLAAVLVAAAIALSAAGCSSAGNEHASEPAPSAAPITMAASTPSATATEEQITQDQYLRGVAESWRGAVPSDDEALAAGALVCEQLSSGIDEDAVKVVQGDGEDAAWNNGQLVTLAIYAFCPEFA